MKAIRGIDFIIYTSQIFFWFSSVNQCAVLYRAHWAQPECCYISGDKNAITSPCSREHALQWGHHDIALDQCNFLEPFLFHYSFLYWMKTLPRAMHLFRQLSKTKFYANPDVKCFQGFYHHCTFLKSYVPQGLLYERCSNLNCSMIYYSYAFPHFIYHTYIFPRKRKFNLTQNCPKHNRWLQKAISHYYYVSDFIQLLIRKIIRAAFRDASFSYSLLSSDCAHF